MTLKIGFIGGGNMATSIISGLYKQQATVQTVVIDRNPEKTGYLKQQFKTITATTVTELVKQSDIVVLAVKPKDIEALLTDNKALFLDKNPLLVSVAAGITISAIEHWLSAKSAIVRVMPNTPSQIGVGACGIVANEKTNAHQRQQIETMMSAVGTVVWVENDNDIDLVTALSGSGPAYFMLFIQSLIDAAIAEGMSEQSARSLALQTAAGSIALIQQSDNSIEQLIAQITSPKGTTERALASFNNDQLQKVVHRAFNSAKHRSKELADELFKT